MSVLRLVATTILVAVATAGATLRVALDSSQRGECFALELRGPAGDRFSGGFDPGFPFVCPDEVGTPQIYTLEMSVPEAPAGRWELRALGAEVTDWAYRVRAVLETPAPRRHGLLRPNIVPWLPSEFGFVAPGSPNPGTAYRPAQPARAAGDLLPRRGSARCALPALLVRHLERR